MPRTTLTARALGRPRRQPACALHPCFEHLLERSDLPERAGQTLRNMSDSCSSTVCSAQPLSVVSGVFKACFHHLAQLTMLAAGAGGAQRAREAVANARTFQSLRGVAGRRCPRSAHVGQQAEQRASSRSSDAPAFADWLFRFITSARITICRAMHTPADIISHNSTAITPLMRNHTTKPVPKLGQARKPFSIYIRESQLSNQ